MKTLTFTLIILTLLTLTVPSAAAQFPDAGRLNLWTTRTVARQHQATELIYLRTIRVARHKNFDRVVFEFSGGMPNYKLEYLKSPFYENEGGKHRIRIAGKAFVQVSLYSIPAVDEQMRLREQKDFIPKGRLRLPSIRELDEAGLFEGYYDFILGISARKAFRVSELSDPRRLVIDFRH